MPKLFHRTNADTAKKSLRIMIGEIKRDKSSFAVYATLIPLNRLLYVVILPLLFSLIIQSLITRPHDWHTPSLLLVGAAAVSVVSLVSSYFGFRKLFAHEEQMRTRLIKRASSELLRRSDQFFANQKVGSLAGDVDKFGGSIVTVLDVLFLSASGLIVNFTASLVIIGFMSPVLLLPLGLITFVLVWRSFAGTMKRGPLRHKRKILSSKLNGTVADILGNQQIVRYFAAETREANRIAGDRAEIEAVAHDEIAVLERESFIRQALLFTFQLLTIAISIWLYINGEVSIAALVFAVTYLGRLTSSLFEVSPIIRNTEQAFLDAAPITDILSTNVDVVDAPDAQALVVSRGSVKFDDVSFRYQESQDGNVIDKLSLDIKPGQRIGLAGHSGGGKTTLTKLLLRFADINAGSIRIDDQNIANITQESLRQAIAYVPQEPLLFHRTLRENIAYGRPNATDEQIIKAAKQAHALEFIEKLPQGFDTLVGERGVKLSGGQRQRIAIARAILKDAPILVLDEATSALDSESEKLIQDALEKLMKGRTSIVIAHRLSTIAKLDRIVVLEKGHIIEDGAHQELLQANGTYAGLWSHQSGGFIEE